jgi:hypothetical protein
MAIRMVEGAHSMSIQSSELRAHRAQSRDACLACHTSASHSPTATRRALWARHGPHRVAPKLRVVRTQRPDPLTLCLPLCPVASVNSILHTLPRRHATRLCNAQAVPVRGLDLQLCNAGYRPRAPRLTPRLREGSRPCPQPTLAVPSLTCRPGRYRVLHRPWSASGLPPNLFGRGLAFSAALAPSKLPLPPLAVPVPPPGVLLDVCAP